MGKTRRNKGKGGERSDPIAKPIKPPSDPALAALREKTVVPALKDLQSADPKSRTAAAGAIANIIQDTKCRKLLLREQVVHIVLNETLTDASLESRAAGWEILKVLTQEEEADFCVHLFRVDVVTAVEHAAKKVTQTVTSPNAAQFSKATQAEQNFVWRIAEALATIISALAEAQDDMLQVVVANKYIVQLLFVLISSDSAPPEVINSGLSCMMTLSEDNPRFVEMILADEETRCFKLLMTLKGGHGLPAVLACGVLHNIFSNMEWFDSSPGRDKSSDAILIPTLTNSLEAAQLNSEAANDQDASSPVEILQLALEILASIGTSLQESIVKGDKTGGGWKGIDDHEDMALDADENSDVSDKENDDDDDEMDQDEIEADMDLVTAADDYPDESSGIDDLPTLKLLLQKAIPQVLKITKFSSNATDGAASLLRGYALSTLNNIAWALSCLDYSDGHNTAVHAAWAPVARTIYTSAVAPVLASDTSDVDLATLVTGLAWAIARTLKEKTPISGDEHKKFMSLYHASRNLPVDEDPFQSLGVKCIGVLGQLALDPAPIELNREIGVFLLTIVASLPETPAANVVEALNQLFDIYGDERHACDREVFWKDGILKHFEESTPKVKAMAKKIDKRKQTELRTRADEAALNLTRFIQYKQKNKP
ncbi:uncharacterized protein BCR38DRAFT_391619 [Pseudomassariella vexata]|uniref:SYO1-like TPR repeats domain-containing protein n=1 Tax=Pseudomassariella vexata TaxID=1141098 RepID=A0A1Y2E1U5_9PEZI|nr:uncharacterized protein BCR38DRAFT_391619 [Pseudomassariella vexata]ORY65324.1 hypothetical protein BCR38DRAFT_391619 [Pseudomassariella vexata]